MERETVSKLHLAMEPTKPPPTAADDESSSSTNDGRSRSSSLPEINARVCDQSILIKIHCERRKGVLAKALAEIESLGLRIAWATVVPFTDSFLHIVVVAQMEEEFSMAVEDLVEELRSALV